jgi:hypothetical protein
LRDVGTSRWQLWKTTLHDFTVHKEVPIPDLTIEFSVPVALIERVILPSG